MEKEAMKGKRGRRIEGFIWDWKGKILFKEWVEEWK